LFYYSRKRWIGEGSGLDVQDVAELEPGKRELQPTKYVTAMK
jgi:signal recognition particle GTPase